MRFPKSLVARIGAVAATAAIAVTGATSAASAATAVPAATATAAHYVHRIPTKLSISNTPAEGPLPEPDRPHQRPPDRRQVRPAPPARLPGAPRLQGALVRGADAVDREVRPRLLPGAHRQEARELPACLPRHQELRAVGQRRRHDRSLAPMRLVPIGASRRRASGFADMDPDMPAGVRLLQAQWRAKTGVLDDALARASTGDEAGFLELWRALQPRLLRFLRVLGCDDPDDVASETWLQVVRDLRKFSGGEDDFRRWLFTIGRHRVIDAARAKSRRPSVPMITGLDILADHQLVEDQVLEGMSVQGAVALLDKPVAGPGRGGGAARHRRSRDPGRRQDPRQVGRRGPGGPASRAEMLAGDPAVRALAGRAAADLGPHATAPNAVGPSQASGRSASEPTLWTLEEVD